MANLRVQLRVCIRCIPGPNEVEQEMMPLSTPMMKMALRDDLSADSESSNSPYTKASKQPQSYSSAWTYPTSTLSGGDGFAFSGMDCSKIFVDLKECNGPIERDDDTIRSEGGVFDICDPRVQRSVHYFGSPKGATQRRRGDMLLLY
ncbi:unnamed protein product [Aphanomyces euteiches]